MLMDQKKKRFLGEDTQEELAEVTHISEVPSTHGVDETDTGRSENNEE